MTDLVNDSDENLAGAATLVSCTGAGFGALRQLVKKIGIIVVGTAALGCATALAATAGWQAPPTPQEPSSHAKSVAPRFVLLAASEKRALSALCSRRGPKVDGSWKATQQQIATLESNLKCISSLRSAGSLRE